jgi:hypothetical protein
VRGSLGNLGHPAVELVATTLRTLLNTLIVAFNFVLPAIVHVIAPAIIPRRFQRLLSLGTHFIPSDHRFVKDNVESSINKFENQLA